MKTLNVLIAIYILVFSCGSFAEKTATGFDIAKCTKCHNESPKDIYYQFPRLAGQNTNYFMASMKAYQNQTRHSTWAARLMSPRRVDLDNETIKQLAEYFNKLPLNNGIPSEDLALVARGKMIYEKGIPEKELDSCTYCHGKKAEGKEKGGNPRLAGQHRAVFMNMMFAYQDDQISNSEEMTNIVKQLSKDDMWALATYLQTLN